MATPTLIWQQLHGWPQLRMTPVVTGEAEALYGGRTGIAVELLMFARLAGVVLGMYGLVRLLLADHLRSYRYLGATFLALYVVFVATAGRAYYLAGLYAPLAPPARWGSSAAAKQVARHAGGWSTATFHLRPSGRRHRRGHARLRPHRPGCAVGNPVAPIEDVDGHLI